MNDEEFDLKNKIAELTSYIASNWPGVEERKKLHAERFALQERLEGLRNTEQNKP